MKKTILLLAASLLAPWTAFPQGEPAVVKISAKPMHEGLASPMLFGNFIELLDDLVPGMRAELLNDRGFEGVTRLANWAYYDGSPNRCDRVWETEHAAVISSNAFNGARCMEFTSLISKPAIIRQSGLGVGKNQTYEFSGYFRSAKTNLELTAILNFTLPTGQILELGRCRLPHLTTEWKKLSGEILSSGATDQATFELRVTGYGDALGDQLSLMPADADRFSGWRFDVEEAIRAVQPAVLRWGGSFCDPGGYHWQDGVGDRDQRTPFPNKVWGRMDPNEVGIDEFCQLCRQVYATPLICVSFADGLQNAVDLVKYCNDDVSTPMGAKRAGNGFQKPYAVRLWQVGNEISGDDENYLRQFPEFSRAIKQAEPRAKVLSSFPSQKLLATAGKDIDYICPHQYSSDFAACENEINRLAAMIRETPDCTHIKIAVTEWNISGGNWGLQRGKFLTLEAALLNARYLNMLLRHSDVVEIACRSNLANSLGSGIFETKGNGVLRRPPFYVMQLYAQHARPVVLALKQAPSGVDMVATKMEYQKYLSVFAVNTNSKPISVVLDLSQFGPTAHVASAEAVGDTLDARQPDVMNHWDATERVRTIPLKLEDNKVILPALSATVIECKY